MDIGQQVSFITNNIDRLPTKDVDFALSLTRQFRAKGFLSPRQTPYIEQMYNRLNGVAPVSVPVNEALGDYSNVIALFNLAGQKLKHPKITVMVDNSEIVLTVAGSKSKHPGYVNITSTGSFSNRIWYGRISPAGEFDARFTANVQFNTALLQFLKELSESPVTVVMAYGKLTGRCSFCNKGLTDSRSKAAGFGKTCASHYGLHAQWKHAADAPQTVVAAL